MRKFLFFVMAAVLFCGCDKEEGGDNLPCPVTEVSVPASSEENPVSPGSSVTIQGQGFTANSEIWLRAMTRAVDVLLARHFRGRESHGRSRYVGYFRLYIDGTGHGPHRARKIPCHPARP